MPVDIRLNNVAFVAYTRYTKKYTDGILVEVVEQVSGNKWVTQHTVQCFLALLYNFAQLFKI